MLSGRELRKSSDAVQVVIWSCGRMMASRLYERDYILLQKKIIIDEKRLLL